MGDLFKPSQQKSTSTSTPWGPQGDALKTAFNEAGSIYDSQKGTPFYQGDLYAKMDGLTSQGINANAGFATGAGANAANNALGAGTNMLGLGGNAFGSLYGAATTDPTQGNIAAAGQYANNPFLDGQIDAASRDVRRNLNENQLPGLNMAASGSGNMNSSRAGVAEGIMRRGAADQIGDISANMRGAAYQNGLGMAENSRVSNMNALNAATGAFGQGLGALQQGANANYQNNQALIQGGQLNQQDQQGQDTAALQQWQGNDSRASDLLNRYYGIVGSQNFGGTTTGTQPGPSMFQNLLGAGTSIAGAIMASDPRLKTNIRATGERTAKHGLPIYTYNYRDGHGLPTGRQVGVMATDVAKVVPEAVLVRNGYLHVDYGKLR